MSIIGAYGFVTINLQSAPTSDGSLKPVGQAAISPDGEPVTAEARVGESVSIHVVKDGSFMVEMNNAGAMVRISGNRVRIDPYDGVWRLKAGDYNACATDPSTDWCGPAQPFNLMDHLTWAFGKFEARPPVTLSFNPYTPASTQ